MGHAMCPSHPEGAQRTTGAGASPAGGGGAAKGRRGPSRAARRRVTRYPAGGGEGEVEEDAVAVEQPLEIRVDGAPLAVTMRTPGDDERLALGFLFGEGLIASRADVGEVEAERPSTHGHPENVVEIRSAGGRALDPERLARTARGTLTTASCGVCGRRTISDLLERVGRVPDGPRLDRSVVAGAVEALRLLQPTFRRTGGVHGALALDASGKALASAEDVGRHNAVDKVVGSLLLEGHIGRGARGARPALLVVSGRVSFEMVQKAVAAGIPVLAGVSAPTTLACDLAEAAGLTLVGFARGTAFNCYAHPGRIA